MTSRPVFIQLPRKLVTFLALLALLALPASIGCSSSGVVSHDEVDGAASHDGVDGAVSHDGGGDAATHDGASAPCPAIGSACNGDETCTRGSETCCRDGTVSTMASEYCSCMGGKFQCAPSDWCYGRPATCAHDAGGASDGADATDGSDARDASDVGTCVLGGACGFEGDTCVSHPSCGFPPTVTCTCSTGRWSCPPACI